MVETLRFADAERLLEAAEAEWVEPRAGWTSLDPPAQRVDPR